MEVLDNPLAAAQLGDTVLAAQTRKNDANLLLCGKLPPGGTADLPDNVLRRFLCRPGFLSHLRSFNGYDGPEILPSSTRHFCLIGADPGHTIGRDGRQGAIGGLLGRMLDAKPYWSSIVRRL